MNDKQTAPTLELAHTAMSEEALFGSSTATGSAGARTPWTRRHRSWASSSMSIPCPATIRRCPSCGTSSAPWSRSWTSRRRRWPGSGHQHPGTGRADGVGSTPTAAKTAPAPPIVAYFHGGGWVQGDLETHHGLCARLAERAGAIVVAVDYRLAPEHKFPAAVDDCLAAYRWLRSRATELGADARRVAWPAIPPAATSPPSCPSSRRRRRSVSTCQALIYPGLDFSLDTPSHRELEDGHVIPRERILGTWSSTFGTTPTGSIRRRRQSARRIGGTAAHHGGHRRLRPAARRGLAYAERLRAAGVDVVYHEYPGPIRRVRQPHEGDPPGPGVGRWRSGTTCARG